MECFPVPMSPRGLPTCAEGNDSTLLQYNDRLSGTAATGWFGADWPKAAPNQPVADVSE